MSSPFNNWQVSGQYPSTIGGTGIGRKFFPAPSNQIGVVGVAPSATSSAGQLNIEGRNILNGYPFAIKAAGNFEVGSGGACPNVLIEVVANTAGLGATPSFTTLMSSGTITAQNLTGTWYDWFFEGKVVGTTQSGTLTGVYTGVVDGNLVRDNVLIDHNLSGLVFGSSSPATSTDPVFGLLVCVTFSVSETGNSANLYQFEVS